jgi:hypothetical protein
MVQDFRGKPGSEGDDAMNRPPHGPQNPTPVDHATDTYDTTDRLVTVIRIQFRTDGRNRRRSDSNRRITVLQTVALGHLATPPKSEPM